jgi:hypothetical protein
MANCANGLEFRLTCEREAGSAIDRIDYVMFVFTGSPRSTAAAKVSS